MDWVEKDSADFRKHATKSFATHVILSELESIPRMERRIGAVDMEVKNLKGMHSGRRVKRERSEPEK
jgi:hypothetical protein